MQAGAFHEFDVYAVVSLLQARYVANALEGFICNYRQRASVAQPCGFLEFLLGQGLLHEQAVALGQPVNHTQCLFLVVPPLVGIDANGYVGHGTYYLYGFLVVVEAHFYL